MSTTPTTTEAAQAASIAPALVSIPCNGLPQLIAALQEIAACCDDALSGEWDRSDDGFEAMLDTVREALAAVGANGGETRP